MSWMLWWQITVWVILGILALGMITTVIVDRPRKSSGSRSETSSEKDRSL